MSQNEVINKRERKDSSDLKSVKQQKIRWDVWTDEWIDVVII